MKAYPILYVSAGDGEYIWTHLGDAPPTEETVIGDINGWRENKFDPSHERIMIGEGEYLPGFPGFSVTFRYKSDFSWDVLDHTNQAIGHMRVLPNLTTVQIRETSRTVPGDDITLGQAIAVGLAYFTRKD